MQPSVDWWTYNQGSLAWSVWIEIFSSTISLHNEACRQQDGAHDRQVSDSGDGIDCSPARLTVHLLDWLQVMRYGDWGMRCWDGRSPWCSSLLA